MRMTDAHMINIIDIYGGLERFARDGRLEAYETDIRRSLSHELSHVLLLAYALCWRGEDLTEVCDEYYTLVERGIW